MAANATLDDFLSKLKNVRQVGDGWEACCPGHEDDRPSLSIHRGERVPFVVKCHAGCTYPQIIMAAGFVTSDFGTNHLGELRPPRPESPKIVATYDYLDESGALLYQKVRYAPKDFRQRQPDGQGGWRWNLDGVRHVPYRLPQLLAADKALPVYVVEGEKSADRLAELGLVATCGSGGAGKWLPQYNEFFAGRNVVILPDNDHPGREHAKQVTTAITTAAPASLKILELPGIPEKADVFDWLAAGGRREDLERLVDATDPEKVKGPEKFRLELISSKQFAETDYRQRYLVKRILVAGQPCMLGGAHKCLKTSIGADLAFSLGTGTRFLGQFDIPEPVDVAIISGESGEFTLKETALRIAASRGWSLAAARVWWGFRLPQVARPDHLAALGEALAARNVKAALIDPAYLCLLSGDAQGRSASNVFDMGSLLMGLTEVGQETGCTMILVHHTRKNPIEPFAVPSLEDLAFAGFSEWARQWLLMGRRREYEPGTGLHELWLNVGGSAGHSGTWAIDIDEGIPDEDFGGRHWKVGVTTPTDARERARQARESSRAADDASKAARNAEKIFGIMTERFPDGETDRQIRIAAGMKPSVFDQAFSILVSEHRVAEIEKVARNGRKYSAFRVSA